MMDVLDEPAVQQRLHYQDLIPAIAQALADLSAGKVVQPVRSVLPVAPHHGFFAVMPAYAGALGAKLVTFYPQNVGLKQGSPNPDVPGCQADKRQLFDAAFGGLPNHLFISGNLPSYAQVTVLRLGNRVLGAVPGEVTTTAGRRMREQMLVSARKAGLPVNEALILGHANGYLEYITTAEEYTAQYYEGGSTIYGPGEAAMFGRTLARLAASVSNGDSLPP